MLIVCLCISAAFVTSQPLTTSSPQVTWDAIGARMQWEAEHGVLVARDGKIAFHKAYGVANRGDGPASSLSPM
jgi:hypothetical protein